MFAQIDEDHGVAILVGKGRFRHFATISDGQMNVEHWRGIDNNGACLRMVDPDADAVIRIQHYATPGQAVQTLRRDYKVGVDYRPIAD